MSDGFFIKVVLSKSDGLPNFGVFLEDETGVLKNRDPALARVAVKAMDQAIALLNANLASLAAEEQPGG